MPMQAQRGGGGIAPTNHIVALEAGGWSAARPGRFPLGKDPAPIVHGTWWASGSF